MYAMQSPELPREALRLHNGERDRDRPSPTPTPSPARPTGVHYYSTASMHKLRRFNKLILFLRLVALCFSLAASIFMAMNTHKPPLNNDGETKSTSNQAKWYDYDAFRYVFAANAIICIYSVAQIGLVMWELLRGNTLLPEMIQVWFDFGHDQADISISLGFAAFVFVACAGLLSGFRVASFLITDSRFHI